VGFAKPITLMICLLVTSCVTPESTQCGDLVCPQGRACVRPNTCVDDDVVDVCGGQSEGETCMLPEVGTGTCQGGLCLIGRCGDGEINAIDACDGTNLNGRTCLDFGANDPSGLTCTADCSFDTTGCTAYCGDSIKGALEECDAEDFGGATCVDHGYYEGLLVCTTTCTVNIGGCSGSCGDGVKNGLEPCDATDFGGDSCMARGYLGDVVPMTCVQGCSLSPNSCTCGGALCAPNTQTCQLSGGIYSCQSV
jgi:hypothetical protein